MIYRANYQLKCPILTSLNQIQVQKGLEISWKANRTQPWSIIHQYNGHAWSMNIDGDIAITGAWTRPSLALTEKETCRCNVILWDEPGRFMISLWQSWQGTGQMKTRSRSTRLYCPCIVSESLPIRCLRLTYFDVNILYRRLAADDRWMAASWISRWHVRRTQA